MPDQSAQQGQRQQSQGQTGQQTGYQPNVSATEQEWQRRINRMDQTFFQSLSRINQLRDQMISYKAATTAGNPVSWNQLESVDQNLSQIASALNEARSSLPIGVSS